MWGLGPIAIAAGGGVDDRRLGDLTLLLYQLDGGLDDRRVGDLAEELHERGVVDDLPVYDLAL